MSRHDEYNAPTRIARGDRHGRAGEPAVPHGSDLPFETVAFSDAAPLILNRYRPLEVAGEGGFGTVQFAFDTRLQRRVAIKCLPLDSDSPETTPGLGEARTAALLTHPNIVSVYDFATDGAYAYIIMECVDGPTLADVIDAEGGMLDLDEAACIAKAVGSALDFAHRNQVLHLDIKPENILITPEGVAKVTDFGIAELAGSTGYGMARGGTVGYMAPEQMGTDPVDERTDVWAFAAVIYELLAGDNPFRTRDLASSLNVIVARRFDPVSCFRDDIDPEADICLDAALSPDPDDRFDSARTFKNTVMEFLGDPDVGQQRFAQSIAPEEELEEDFDDRGLWERLGTRGTGIIERIICAVSCTWLAWLAASVAQVSPVVLYTVLAAVGVGSLCVPLLGCALCIIALTTGFFMAGVPVAGVAIGVVGALWWLFLGRQSRPSCAFAFALPAALPIMLGQTIPLLVGFRLRPLHALVTVAFGSLLVLAATVLTGGSAPFAAGIMPVSTDLADSEALIAGMKTLVSAPQTWIVIAGWVLSAVLMAKLCTHGNKMVSIIGSLLGCAIMVLAIMACGYVSDGRILSSAEVLPLVQTGIAFAIMCTVTALGAPWHPEALPEEE